MPQSKDDKRRQFNTQQVILPDSEDVFFNVYDSAENGYLSVQGSAATQPTYFVMGFNKSFRVIQFKDDEAAEDWFLDKDHYRVVMRLDR